MILESYENFVQKLLQVGFWQGFMGANFKVQYQCNNEGSEPEIEPEKGSQTTNRGSQTC